MLLENVVFRNWWDSRMVLARRKHMTTWNIDTSHSGAHFTVRHMVVSKVRGAFSRWQGTLQFDEQNPEASKVSVQIEAASIDTREEKRDAHLRSPDFFDVAQYPTLSFESTKVEKVEGSSYRVTGELTIHGITKQVVLDTDFLGAGKDPWGNDRVGFEASTSINRKDFGLAWNQALEAGGVLVGDKIEISLDVEAVKAQATSQAA
jgi:polyisoprenoid-binding protein YceI